MRENYKMDNAVKAIVGILYLGLLLGVGVDIATNNYFEASFLAIYGVGTAFCLRREYNRANRANRARAAETQLKESHTIRDPGELRKLQNSKINYLANEAHPNQASIATTASFTEMSANHGNNLKIASIAFLVLAVLAAIAAVVITIYFPPSAILFGLGWNTIAGVVAGVCGLTSGGFFAADRYIEYGPTDEFGLRISRDSVGEEIARQTLNSHGERPRPSGGLDLLQIQRESEESNESERFHSVGSFAESFESAKSFSDSDRDERSTRGSTSS